MTTFNKTNTKTHDVTQNVFIWLTIVKPTNCLRIHVNFAVHRQTNDLQRYRQTYNIEFSPDVMAQ